MNKETIAKIVFPIEHLTVDGEHPSADQIIALAVNDLYDDIVGSFYPDYVLPDEDSVVY